MARRIIFNRAKNKINSINPVDYHQEDISDIIEQDFSVKKTQSEEKHIIKNNEFGDLKVNPSNNEEIGSNEKYIIKGVLLESPRLMKAGLTIKEAYEEKGEGFAKLIVNTGSAARSNKKEIKGMIPIIKDGNQYYFKFDRGDSIKALCKRHYYNGMVQNNIVDKDIEIYHGNDERGLRGIMKEIRGVGDVMVDRYIEAYGIDKAHLGNVDDLEKIGFRREVAERVAIEWSAGVAYKENMQLLRYSYKLPKDISESLISSYGDSLKKILKTDPWSLNVGNVNFEVWDRIAAHNGIKMNAKSRIRAGVAFYIRKMIEENGSTCWLSGNQNIKKTDNEINISNNKKSSENNSTSSFGRKRRIIVSSNKTPSTHKTPSVSEKYNNERYNSILKKLSGGEKSSSSIMLKDIRDAIDYLVSDECYEKNPQLSLIKDKNEKGEELIFPIENHKMEVELANKIACIASMPPMRSREEAKKGVDAVCKTKGIVLNDEQYNAAIDACTYRFTVITGGAGTGKSTIQDVIASTLVYFNDQVSLSSPTGKAAKRLSQTTKRPANTIHRQLEITKADDGSLEFKRNFKNPIDGNTALIGDEMGMADTYILNSWLDAFPINGSVVLVGDFNQLASVGKGQVFRDIIEANNPKIHVNKLTISMRTNDNSDVTWAGREILKGKNPFRERNNIRGVTHYEASGTGILEQINEIAHDIFPSHGYEATKDTIILSPLRGKTESKKNKLLEGTVSELNMSFKMGFNPAQSKDEQNIGIYGLTKGDPIIGTKNNYNIDIRNGEDGIVEEINLNNPNNPIIKANIDGMIKTLSEAEGLKDVELAYANTVHKFQGSERPAVIIAIPSGYSAKKLLSRNLLYTALTRAENEVHIVGPMSMIDWAVNNEEKRLTGLSSFINRRINELEKLPVKEKIKENMFLSRLIEKRYKVLPKEKVNVIEKFMQECGIEDNNIKFEKKNETVKQINDFNYGM